MTDAKQVGWFTVGTSPEVPVARQRRSAEWTLRSGQPSTIVVRSRRVCHGSAVGLVALSVINAMGLVGGDSPARVLSTHGIRWRRGNDGRATSTCVAMSTLRIGVVAIGGFNATGVIWSQSVAVHYRVSRGGFVECGWPCGRSERRPYKWWWKLWPRELGVAGVSAPRPWVPDRGRG